MHSGIDDCSANPTCPPLIGYPPTCSHRTPPPVLTIPRHLSTAHWLPSHMFSPYPPPVHHSQVTPTCSRQTHHLFPHPRVHHIVPSHMFQPTSQLNPSTCFRQPSTCFRTPGFSKLRESAPPPVFKGTEPETTVGGVLHYGPNQHASLRNRDQFNSFNM